VKIVIDTSILVDYIRTGRSLSGLIKLGSSGKTKLMVPVIVIGELMAGRLMKHRQARESVAKIMKGMSIVDINSEIACRYGEIFRAGMFHGNDAWIAACCLVHKAKLATLNPKHFIDVKGFGLYNVKQ